VGRGYYTGKFGNGLMQGTFSAFLYILKSNFKRDEWKRSENGRMEHPKAMEYESGKASSDF
jgi:hypothetical protein